MYIKEIRVNEIVVDKFIYRVSRTEELNIEYTVSINNTTPDKVRSIHIDGVKYTVQTIESYLKSIEDEAYNLCSWRNIVTTGTKINSQQILLDYFVVHPITLIDIEFRKALRFSVLENLTITDYLASSVCDTFVCFTAVDSKSLIDVFIAHEKPTLTLLVPKDGGSGTSKADRICIEVVDKAVFNKCLAKRRFSIGN